MKLNLPAVEADDGFDSGNDDGSRLIVGDLIKCDTTRSEPWIDREGTPLDLSREWFVMTTRHALQRWEDEQPVETIIKQKGQPLPDLDELNAKIPQSQWEEGFDGKPKPPWQQQWFVHLLDPQTAERRTYVGGSWGAMRGVGELQDDVFCMRRLRGEAVSPIVMLDTKPMKTKYGIKPRPWFRTVRWVELNVSASAPAIEHQPAATAGLTIGGYPEDYATASGGRVSNKLKAVEKPTLSEELDDEIPDFPA
jgi:hypothetical protein